VDIPVLKYVDILIGLALVMVIVSTIVLAITQTLLNSTFARARHLQRGLSRLIGNVEPALLRDHSRYLSQLLLRHPLIGQQTILTPVRKLWNLVRAKSSTRANESVEPLPLLAPGSVVQREELAYLLIEFAAGEGPLMELANEGAAPNKIGDVQNAVAQALRKTGVEDPAATLRAIRLKVVENERANPEHPSSRWRANAVADCANSDFVAKVHAGFDSTMARVTDGFGWESKLWVSAVALLVAVALQLDSFALIKRLSMDDAYRAALVQRAEKLQAEMKPDQTPAERTTTQENLTKVKESVALLDSPTFDLLPRTRQLPSAAAMPGVLLSWVLLSLGAPFWFDLLKNLLKLRSMLAKKDDAERQQRDTAQPPVPRVPASAAAAAGAAIDVIDEAGDLAISGAVG
jgi:hypothetical protein